MARTTVSISFASSEILKTLKKRFNVKSYDALVQRLQDIQPSSEEESSSSSSDDEARPGPEKRRKINVREPLFSFDVLDERHEMLEYYTGMDRETFKVLLKRLEEVRKCFSFFSSLPSLLFLVIFSL